MIISENNQLGLKFLNKDKEFTDKLIKFSNIKNFTTIYEKLENGLHKEIGKYTKENIANLSNEKKYLISYNENNLFIKNAYILSTLILNKFDKEAYHKPFLICDNVYHVAEMIKIDNNFDIKILQKINNGIYTYLMGKNKFIQFNIIDGNIQGFIFEHLDNVIYFHTFAVNQKYNTFGINFDDEKLYKFLKLIIFIELGDITIEEIAAGKCNNKTKNEGKTKNSSKFNVEIIDSKWNTISIRTEGFAVRGHFRLQPCGPKMKDFKLIWIKAFEKHGYIRNGNKLKNENI